MLRICHNAAAKNLVDREAMAGCCDVSPAIRLLQQSD
jgi:hypothetical protein